MFELIKGYAHQLCQNYGDEVFQRAFCPPKTKLEILRDLVRDASAQLSSYAFSEPMPEEEKSYSPVQTAMVIGGSALFVMGTAYAGYQYYQYRKNLRLPNALKNEIDSMLSHNSVEMDQAIVDMIKSLPSHLRAESVSRLLHLYPVRFAEAFLSQGIITWSIFLELETFTEKQVIAIEEKLKNFPADDQCLNALAKKGWFHFVDMQYDILHRYVAVMKHKGTASTEYIQTHSMHALDNDNTTSLHCAVKFDRPDLLQEILKQKNAELILNRANKSGETALSCALKNSNLDCGMALILAGANFVSNMSVRNKTPRWSYALQNGQFELVFAMAQKGLSLSLMSPAGSVLAACLMTSQQAELVSLLDVDNKYIDLVLNEAKNVQDFSHSLIQLVLKNENLFKRYGGKLLSVLPKSVQLECINYIFTSLAQSHSAGPEDKLNAFELSMLGENEKRVLLEKTVDMLVHIEAFENAKLLLQLLNRTNLSAHAIVSHYLTMQQSITLKTKTKADVKKHPHPELDIALLNWKLRYANNLDVEGQGQKAFEIYRSIKNEEATTPLYRKKKEACAMIVLNDLEKQDNESDADFQYRRLDTAIGYLVKANQLEVAKRLIIERDNPKSSRVSTQLNLASQWKKASPSQKQACNVNDANTKTRIGALRQLYK